MTFEFVPRGLNGLRQRIHHENDLDYDYAADKENNLAIYFKGKDPLDPTVPATYQLWDKKIGAAWSLEVLDGYYTWGYLDKVQNGSGVTANRLAVLMAMHRADELPLPILAAQEGYNIYHKNFRQTYSLHFIKNWAVFDEWVAEKRNYLRKSEETAKLPLRKAWWKLW